MAGKGFAVIEYGGEKSPFAVEATGFETNPKIREVAESTIGGTTREEFTGGVERVRGTVRVQELEDEGLQNAFDALYLKLQTARDEKDPAQRRKVLSVVYFKDSLLTTESGRLVVTGAMVTKLGMIEFNKTSDDPREFEVEFAHLGSNFKKAGGA